MANACKLSPKRAKGDSWYKDNEYLYYDDARVVAGARLDGYLQWAHVSSGHTRCNHSVELVREPFYSRLTCVELRAQMQPIVDSCGCQATKPSNLPDRGLVSSLPIPYCANVPLYVEFIQGLPRFGSYDSCLLATRGLNGFTRVFPCNKKMTGEQTVYILVQQWVAHYGTSKRVHSDEDIRIRSDTGWYE